MTSPTQASESAAVPHTIPSSSPAFSPTSAQQSTTPRSLDKPSPLTQSKLPFPFAAGLSPTLLTAASLDRAIHQSQALYAYYNQLYSWAAATQRPDTTTAASKPTKKSPAEKHKAKQKKPLPKSPGSMPSSSKDSITSPKSLLGSYLSCQCHLFGYKEAHAPTCLVYQYSRMYPPMFAVPNVTSSHATAQLTSPSNKQSVAASSTTASPTASSSSASTLSSQSHTIHYKNSQDTTPAKSTYPYTYPYPYSLAMSPGLGYSFTNGFAFDKDGAMDLTGSKKRTSPPQSEPREVKRPCRPSPVYPSPPETSILDLSVKK